MCHSLSVRRNRRCEPQNRRPLSSQIRPVQLLLPRRGQKGESAAVPLASFSQNADVSVLSPFIRHSLQLFMFCNLCLLSLPSCATPLSRSRGWWRIKMGKHTMFCLGRGTRRWSALVWCRAAEGERTAPTGDRKPSIRRSKPKSCGGRLRCRKIFPDAYNISQVQAQSTAFLLLFL